MEGMRFTRNIQNMRSFGKKVVLRSPPIPFPDLKHVGAFFSKSFLNFTQIYSKILRILQEERSDY